MWPFSPSPLQLSLTKSKTLRSPLAALGSRPLELDSPASPRPLELDSPQHCSSAAQLTASRPRSKSKRLTPPHGRLSPPRVSRPRTDARRASVRLRPPLTRSASRSSLTATPPHTAHCHSSSPSVIHLTDHGHLSPVTTTAPHTAHCHSASPSGLSHTSQSLRRGSASHSPDSHLSRLRVRGHSIRRGSASHSPDSHLSRLRGHSATTLRPLPITLLSSRLSIFGLQLCPLISLLSICGWGCGVPLSNFPYLIIWTIEMISLFLKLL
ncbi:hypothetical protein Scep_025423 [Stephania cephalantha]|uniref:Uncharacterized protein n=1 Tax=Stephania cephalantha TaxID=152367 RepID=A0AAP0ES50_9MAGN